MSEPPRLRPVPKPGLPGRPLESWKEIASYLNRTVRTARRWEEAEGLPVHRHLHQKRDSVFAYVSELDEWWSHRRAGLDPATELPRPRLKRAGGRRIWLTVGASAILALTGLCVWLAWPNRRPALPFAARDWILVADFINRTGEPVFDNSLTTAFTVSLQQSAHVNVLPQVRIGDALRRMGKDANVRIDEPLGREICLRENAKALIVGELAKVGRQYAISARLLDPQTDEAVRAYIERAKGQDQILGVLGEVARRIRKDLGESLGAIRRNDRPLPQVTTRSLQALQLYAEGQQRWRKGAHQDALRLFQSALEYDASFAMAHVALGSAYCSHIFSDPVKGKAHYEKALEYSERITERERSLLQAAYQRGSSGKSVGNRGASGMGLREESVELAAGRVEGALLVFPSVVNERTAVLMDYVADKSFRGKPSQRGFFVDVADDLSAEKPQIVDMALDGLLRQS